MLNVKCPASALSPSACQAPFLGLPVFLFCFVLFWFAFCIIHGSGRVAKNEEGLGTYHMDGIRWTCKGRGIHIKIIH